jgi:hypothetical protein
MAQRRPIESYTLHAGLDRIRMRRKVEYGFAMRDSEWGQFVLTAGDVMAARHFDREGDRNNRYEWGARWTRFQKGP